MLTLVTGPVPRNDRRASWAGTTVPEAVVPDRSTEGWGVRLSRTTVGSTSPGVPAPPVQLARASETIRSGNDERFMAYLDAFCAPFSATRPSRSVTTRG